MEKVSGSYAEPLSCGDRVFYVDYAASGSDRWRKAIVLQRKKDYVYSSGIYRSHGYDLYDIKNCTTVSRTRQDIRKYKHTKIEREILERANKHLGEMNREFMKSDFYNLNSDKPAEFEIKDYDEAIKNNKHPMDTTPSPRPSNSEPEIKKEPEEEGTPSTIEAPTESPAADTAPASSRGSRLLKNLESNLDGKAWACNDTHGRRLRVRTTAINEGEE